VSGGRLLTLVGVGGVGKTRLALRAAGAAREVHPDGVWLVELSALRAGGQVPLAVMETLRLVDQSTYSAIEALSVWARDKRLLLVLDSCEHLLTDCVTLVADLLAAAPGLRVLATSRERLGMPVERVLAVDLLPVGDPGGPGNPEGRPHADLRDAPRLIAHPSAATASTSTSTPSRTSRATTVVRAGSGMQSAKNSR
jgi:predicted ATPase